jgi:hypothetical protein
MNNVPVWHQAGKSENDKVLVQNSDVYMLKEQHTCMTHDKKTTSRKLT